MSRPNKLDFLNGDIDELYSITTNKTEIARKLLEKHKTYFDTQEYTDKEDAVRGHVRRYLKENNGTDTHDALQKECEAVGIPLDSVNHYWHKGEHFSIHAKNGQTNYFAIRDEIIKEMSEHAPVYPVLKRETITDGHLFVIDPADVHLNKLCSAFETGEAYNMQIAVQRVKEGVQGIINKMQGFNIDKILFIAGNDKLHIDNPKSTTTSGTFQDSEMMWYDAFKIAKQLEIEVIEMLLTIADVHYEYNPSNHDYTNGFFLADSISSWFANNKNITFNTSMAHRKYFRYHNNLIGSTHGDGAKVQDLALLMAHEGGKDWSECKHRYVYTHHLHHKQSKDYMSVCVETLRSPSGTDSWHHRNGFQHAPKAIEGYIHHPLHGQVARITHLF